MQFLHVLRPFLHHLNGSRRSWDLEDFTENAQEARKAQELLESLPPTRLEETCSRIFGLERPVLKDFEGKSKEIVGFRWCSSSGGRVGSLQRVSRADVMRRASAAPALHPRLPLELHRSMALCQGEGL